MPSQFQPFASIRSPNLSLSAARGKGPAMRPRFSGDASCPFLLAACGFNFDPPKQVFREYLASIDELVIWRYVVAGSFLWNSGDCRQRIGPGMVLTTHQPAPTRLVISNEGVCVLGVLCVGKPALAYFDQIVARFGRSHTLPQQSEPVRRAEELVRQVRANRQRSPFFWSEQCFLWLSIYHRHLEEHRRSMPRLSALSSPSSRLFSTMPRTVKSYAAQLGYSPSHFSRQIAKKWKDSPGRLLREIRLRHASRLLVNSVDRVQLVAEKAGYSSVPAFITAFKKAYGQTPLSYRHAHR